MASTLQVILHSDVDHLGKSGDLVKVRPGYARNYLIPRGFAVTATASEIKQVAHQKAIALAKYEKSKKEASELASKLSALTIKLTHTAGEDGKLFGSVTTKEIEAALKALGFDIDRKKMHLAEPIKNLGLFEVPVKLMSEVNANVKVEVSKK